MPSNKISYACRRINWIEPEIFFSSRSTRPAQTFSFFINNPPSPYQTEKEDEWCYVSCDIGNNFFLYTPEMATKPLITIRLTDDLNFERISSLFATALSDISPACGKYSISPFKGGLVGFINYETLKSFENITLRQKEKSPARESSVFIAPSSFVAFNKTKNEAYLYTATRDTNNKKNHTATDSSYYEIMPEENFSPQERKFFPKSSMNPEEFETAVRTVKNYISKGDIFQANIARRWRINFSNKKNARIPDGKKIFLNLLKINPSPYACYIKFKDTEIISSSPELLVRRRGDMIETRPIAGTRPRGTTHLEDRRLSSRLILSPKERAEHIMLVDLERNDLGKICHHGTCRVAKPLVIEKYSHVQHIVSYITGKARKNLRPADVLKAMFPGGTITGCPKIRAIQIIDEVEGVERGPYCGSAGWINGGKSANDMEFNILIRTIIKTPGIIDFYAGAGIVADSKPLKEFEETRHKALALARALGTRIK